MVSRREPQHQRRATAAWPCNIRAPPSRCLRGACTSLALPRRHERAAMAGHAQPGAFTGSRRVSGPCCTSVGSPQPTARSSTRETPSHSSVAAVDGAGATHAACVGQSSSAALSTASAIGACKVQQVQQESCTCACMVQVPAADNRPRTTAEGCCLPGVHLRCWPALQAHACFRQPDSMRPADHRPVRCRRSSRWQT